MILCQLPLYRKHKRHTHRICVCVLVICKMPYDDYFRLVAYRGQLLTFLASGFANLTMAKPQKHVSRLSATVAFDEYVDRLIHKWEYTCCPDGIYRPMEDPPLAIDLIRAARIERSKKADARRNILPPSPRVIRPMRRRLLEFH